MQSAAKKQQVDRLFLPPDMKLAALEERIKTLPNRSPAAVAATIQQYGIRNTAIDLDAVAEKYGRRAKAGAVAAITLVSLLALSTCAYGQAPSTSASDSSVLTQEYAERPLFERYYEALDRQQQLQRRGF